MDLQLCSFEQSIKLKKDGFDWECCHCYWYNINKDKPLLKQVPFSNFNNWDDNGVVIFKKGEKICSVPSIQHALMWYREVKGIYGRITLDATKKWFFDAYDMKSGYLVLDFFDCNPNLYENYFEAESSLLTEIQNLKFD